MKRYYFVGIGGSGMSPLAQILCQRGNWVGGSDRNFDRNSHQDFFSKLQMLGIHLFPQDGSAVSGDIDCMVVSTAIEHNNRELAGARARNIPVVHRADLLARLFNESHGIGVAGTSGKSTVTGMVAAILDAAGMDPTFINGGIIKSFISDDLIGNCRNGSSKIMVAEIDESDGSIIHFSPRVGVITNISKDHKELDELKELFQTFAAHTSQQLIVNGDNPPARETAAHDLLTFGLQGDNDIFPADVAFSPQAVRFRLQDTPFSLNVPGEHNVYNALAAIAVGVTLNIPLATMRDGLASFAGIQRRLEIVGKKKGITVVDDFGHNPDKIVASIRALRPMGKRLLILFQPHGYGPTKFLLRELGRAFSSALLSTDFLVCLNIYDAGGTADRTVTSQDLIDTVTGPGLFYAPDRSDALALIKETARKDDIIAVMGARDDSLRLFAQRILEEI